MKEVQWRSNTRLGEGNSANRERLRRIAAADDGAAIDQLERAIHRSYFANLIVEGCADAQTVMESAAITELTTDELCDQVADQ
ncbi:hypothetical protein [Streptomyces sp. CNQ431]|uniref:hypothetical protein n=1 Tax=Streptomyces sp. CNQ431 TaxID=1571532 RepID=UPI00053D659C|nr:hypothetical protein [Streptomyces sp. CNQ431]